MTTLQVNLSDAVGGMTDVLTSNGAGNNGVYAYAVYFDSAGTAHWTQMVNNGAVVGTGTYDIALPSTYSSGKVYFLIQSQGSSTESQTDLQTAITSQSDINWQNAASQSYRYDSFEVTLTGGVNDQGNLSSIEGFGIPMGVQIDYTGGATASVGYKNVGSTGGGDNIFGQLPTDTYYEFAAGSALEGVIHRAAISPTQSVGIGGSQYSASDWNTYIASLEGDAAENVKLTGFFNGAKDAAGLWHNGGFFSYGLEWDASQGVFWLSPTDNSQIKGYIKITPDDLANSIYSTLGNVEIYASKTDANPYTIYNPTDPGAETPEMNTGANNQWGKVLGQFLTGFTAGFYGMMGHSENSDAALVDLSKNWNWDPTYSFGANVGGATPIFMDQYSKVFFLNSNSYGSNYSDALMSQYSVGGPLISVYDPNATPPGDIDTIHLTLFSDNEQATGYTTPEIFNYLNPSSGLQYALPTAPHSGSSVTLNFQNSGILLDNDAPLYIDVLTGYNGSGEPIFDRVQLGGTGIANPWQIWTFGGSGTDYSVSSSGGSGQDGSLTLAGFPTATGSNGTSWYRIVVGEGDAQKIFNLYIETDSSGNFVNDTGSVAVDGLAFIAPGSTSGSILNTFTLNFMPGSTLTFDPSLVHSTGDYSYNSVDPNAPVAGTLVSGAFDAAAGQSSQVSNTITVGDGQLAFGWTGTNDDAGTVSWISGLTNKIIGLNVALLNIVATAGEAGYFAPLVAVADVDGQWQTSVMQAFGNGTYNITMTEYAARDTNFTHALTNSSSLLTVTVNMSDLDLTAGSDGSGIALVSDGGATQGNWVSFNTVSSSLPADATLLIYATNASGQMIGRDGNVTSDLDAAVIGHVGAVGNDQGATMLYGSQMAYLGLGQELHFAIKTGQDTINMDSHAQVTTQPDGSLVLNVGGVVLTAATSNTLDQSAQMASVQRMYDLPVVYLHQGDQLDVQVVGSAHNTNTLAFVKFDINFATGEVSVGGVDYGSDGFSDAVKHYLDGGYQSDHGGGNFSDTTTWTVHGSDGFYAPVLITQSGDVFVVGDGNSGGAEYIRMYGENTFGFEDLTAAQGSDFDYNDMVMKLSVHSALG